MRAWRPSSGWLAAGPETAGRAALAVVVAGGLVAGGLTTMAIVASNTLDSAPRPQAGVTPDADPGSGTPLQVGSSPGDSPTPTPGPTDRPT